MELLTPWQQLLWLVCAVALIVPLVSWGVIGIIRGYFNAKEQHTGRIAKAIANAINQVAGDANKKLDEVLKKVKDGEPTDKKNE